MVVSTRPQPSDMSSGWNAIIAAGTPHGANRHAPARETRAYTWCISRESRKETTLWTDNSGELESVPVRRQMGTVELAGTPEREGITA